MNLGLYIHIPFCRSRCPYCDFVFEVRKTHLADRYAAAVATEFLARASWAESPVFDTLYFGGGTPSAVPAETLGHILEAVRKNATVMPDAELTAEANPGDRAAFPALRGLGINRLSLGVQALDGRTLKALGRAHTSADAQEACAAARKAGFDNLGIDLIFGAPGQSLGEFRSTLEGAIALSPEHLSVYGLTVEPGTAFGRRAEKGRLDLPPESEQAAMFSCAMDGLEAAGYQHYEISNFARPGFESRHNLCYWQGRPYLGLGVSAHSFLDGRRCWNVSDLGAYLQSVEEGGNPVEGEEEPDAGGRFLERVMLGLRQRQGLDAGILDGEVRIRPSLDRLLENRLLERSKGRIRLTRRGLILADLVCAELVKGA